MRAAGLARALLALPAGAEEPGTARCALVGPLALSAHIGFVREVAGQDRAAATDAAARLDTLIALHGRLGCDDGQLTAAIECLTGRLLARATAPPAELAGACMDAAGMPTR